MFSFVVSILALVVAMRQQREIQRLLDEVAGLRAHVGGHEKQLVIVNRSIGLLTVPDSRPTMAMPQNASHTQTGGLSNDAIQLKVDGMNRVCENRRASDHSEPRRLGGLSALTRARADADARTTIEIKEPK